MPTFSVIIPVYNSEKTLERAIQSVLNQSFNDYEIIAINDGSTDGSLDILKKIEKKCNYLKIINQENLGPGLSRNRGIEYAQGEYIAFLDADDYWENDFFETILKVSKNKTADYIYVEMIKEDVNGKVISKTNFIKYEKCSKEQMICMQMTGKLPWGMAKVIKRNIILEADCKFRNFSVGEECIFSYEALKNSNKISFSDKAIYHYVQNTNGQHKKGSDDPWNSLVNNFKEYLKEKNEFTRYEKSINSLAIKAMSISFYRYANKFSFYTAIDKMKEKYTYYSNNYDLENYNKDILDNRNCWNL